MMAKLVVVGLLGLAGCPVPALSSAAVPGYLQYTDYAGKPMAVT